MGNWLILAAKRITPRRLRAHALILALCLWGICAVDYANAGFFDRAGNIKFQDFLSFYISGKLIVQGRASDLYNESLRNTEMLAIVQPVSGQPLPSSTVQSARNVRIPNLYGPQIALLFAPLSRLPFLAAAVLWVALSSWIYFLCVFTIWRSCPVLRPYAGTTAISAIAFPPLFHFFLRGQLSALVLLGFALAFVALRDERRILAGVALGFLVVKPQFLVAIPVILLVTHSWKILGGVVASSAAQLMFTRLYFGSSAMHNYLNMLGHVSDWLSTAELSLAPIQMHSLRSFWRLLIPWTPGVWVFYLLSSLVVIAIAARIWKSSSPLALRFSALILAAVLVNPHLFVYDLMVMAPVFLLLGNWSMENAYHPATPSLRISLYLAFLLPLFGPLARWTHLQLSVLVFLFLLSTLHRIATSSHKLALAESAVV